MTYAEAVKTQRKKIIMPQMKFADYLGVPFGIVIRWENDRFDTQYRCFFFNFQGVFTGFFVEMLFCLFDDSYKLYHFTISNIG